MYRKIEEREKTREFEKHCNFLLTSSNNKIYTKFTVMLQQCSFCLLLIREVVPLCGLYSELERREKD